MKLEKLAVSAAEPNKFLSLLKKEQGLVDAGLEMIDQMQLAMQSGTAAKDKRAPNSQSTSEAKRPIKLASKKLKPEGALSTSSSSNTELVKINGDGDRLKGPTLVLELEEFPDVKIPTNMSLATLMSAVRLQKPDAFLDTLVFTIRTEVGHLSQMQPRSSSEGQGMEDGSEGNLSRETKESVPGVFNVTPLPSTVEVFSVMGGLGLLAKHLPIVYPETLRQIAVGSRFTGSVGIVMNMEKESPVAMNDNDWVKVENSDDFYDVSH